MKRLEEFLGFHISTQEIHHPQGFSLTQKHNLTFYDASYLYLSKSQNLPLLTLDKHLLPFSPLLKSHSNLKLLPLTQEFSQKEDLFKS